MYMKKKAVPYHTFTEVLSMIGRHSHSAGLYIITDDSNTGHLIQYPFRSDHFIIVMQLDGESGYTINFVDHRLHKGQIQFISPAAIRQFSDTLPGSRFAGLVFTSAFLAQSGLSTKHTDMLGFFSVPHPIDLETGDFDSLLHIHRLLQNKCTTTTDTPLDKEVVHHLFLAFLYELGSIYQRYNSHKKIQLTRKEDIAMRFTKLLGESFKEERSVQFYAEQLNLSPRYLGQTIKEATGKSAGDLIDEIVILEAKALLNDVSLTIAQVAEALYFSDQFFFSKYFKRQTGITPSEYRRTS